MPEFTIDEEGQIIPLPSPPSIPPPTPEPVAEVEYKPVREPAPAPVLEPVPEPAEDELAGLFEVPQPTDNDMVTDHLFEVSEADIMGGEDDDLSDLVDVSQADIMGDSEGEPYPGTPPTGEPLQRPPPTKRFKRTSRRYQPPPGTSLSGLRY